MYRYSYNFLLLADENFKYEDNWLNGVSVDIFLKLFNNHGKEVLFDDDETEKKVKIPHSSPFFLNDEGYLHELVNVYFNPNADRYVDIHINDEILDKSGYTLEYTIGGYEKEISDNNKEDELMTAIPIPDEEYINIIDSNISKFDNNMNSPAHVSSLYIVDD